MKRRNAIEDWMLPCTGHIPQANEVVQCQQKRSRKRRRHDKAGVLAPRYALEHMDSAGKVNLNIIVWISRIAASRNFTGSCKADLEGSTMHHVLDTSGTAISQMPSSLVRP
jgi:hypothetical protein